MLEEHGMNLNAMIATESMNEFEGESIKENELNHESIEENELNHESIEENKLNHESEYKCKNATKEKREKRKHKIPKSVKKRAEKQGRLKRS